MIFYLVKWQQKTLNELKEGLSFLNLVATRKFCQKSTEVIVRENLIIFKRKWKHNLDKSSSYNRRKHISSLLLPLLCILMSLHKPKAVGISFCIIMLWLDRERDPCLVLNWKSRHRGRVRVRTTRKVVFVLWYSWLDIRETSLLILYPKVDLPVSRFSIHCIGKEQLIHKIISK